VSLPCGYRACDPPGMVTSRGRTCAPFLVVGSVLLAGLALVGPPPAVGADDRRGGPCRSGYVALTFDDGPAGPTDRLVRILSEAHVPATFFMVGQRVAAGPRLTRRVERAGFLIGNHSWAHTDMTTQTSGEVAATLRATDAVLRRVGTHPTRLMRPPYGALDDAAREGIRAAGYVPVLWTVDSRDYAGGSAAQIANRILDGLRPNRTNIVLQHDGVTRSPISGGSSTRCRPSLTLSPPRARRSGISEMRRTYLLPRPSTTSPPIARSRGVPEATRCTVARALAPSPR